MVRLRRWWWDARSWARWWLLCACGRVTGHRWRMLGTALSDDERYYEIRRCHLCGKLDMEWLT